MFNRHCIDKLRENKLREKKDLDASDEGLTATIEAHRVETSVRSACPRGAGDGKSRGSCVDAMAPDVSRLGLVVGVVGVLPFGRGVCVV